MGTVRKKETTLTYLGIEDREQCNLSGPHDLSLRRSSILLCSHSNNDRDSSNASVGPPKIASRTDTWLCRNLHAAQKGSYPVQTSEVPRSRGEEKESR